ncbi:autotransporter domain-containing protein [Phyllobacterium sp. K27]
MINPVFKCTAAAKRSWPLLATTALVSCLAGLATTVSAQAQSVMTSGDVNPSPATSPVWNVGGVLNVGDSGAGALTVEGGGIVTSTYGQIGVQAGGEGTVTVRGSGSGWLSNSSIYVGFFGTGTLNIEDGGVVSNVQSGYIGNNPGSTGAVTVTGAGSTWENTNYLSVGYMGSGALNIANGGKVTNNFGYIGANLGSIGKVSVSGSGSHWENSGGLVIGQVAEGTLSIEDGGVVSNTTGDIGFSPGSIGKVTVTGDDSAWTNDKFLVVGNYGTGTLTVAQGGTVSSEGGSIGVQAGSTGTVTVKDAGSAWTMVDDLVIGSGGMGTLSVEAGGTVNNGFGYVGTGAGAEGHVNVTGAGSQWTSAHSLFVGDAGGSGALLIEDGGTVTNGYGVIGSGTGTGTNGAVVVTGENSMWSNLGDLNLGNSGTGTLLIEQGGTVVTGRAGFVGYGTDGFGKVTVSGEGTSWSSSLDVFVGVFGKGELEIKGGSSVSSFDGIVGDFAGSNGTVNVNGVGSSWTMRNVLEVGNTGEGTLNIEDGGVITSVVGWIGDNPGSSGTVMVMGTGSAWTIGHSLGVGYMGAANLTVANGGRVGSGAGYIGASAGSAGTVAVTGAGSFWSNSGNLYLGLSGAGTLTVSNSGTVSASQITIAANPGSTGTLNIGAAAGQPAIAGGTLNTSEVRFGAGDGTLHFNHTGTDYEFAPAIIGSGPVSVSAGTTRLLADSSSFAGPVSIAGGHLLVDGSLGNDTSAVSVTQGGRLGGMGAIGGAVTIADGTLIGVQGQTLSMDSLTLSNNSTVDVTLGTSGDSGLFNVTGDLTLDGTLTITDAGGFGAGVYRLIDYGGVFVDRGLSIGATPDGVSANDVLIQTAAAGSVNLVSTAGAELGFWDGGNTALHDNGSVDGGAGTWREDGRNWTGMDGSLNGSFRPKPTFAIFQGATGTVTVDASAGPISATGMQFVTDGYRIEGDAIALAGAGSESIIRVGDGTQQGNGVSATIAAGLTGNGRLVKTDNGTLILSGDNSYTGGTELRGGTLEIASDSAFGAAHSDIVFSGGVLSSTADLTSARNISITGSSNAAFVVSQDTKASFSGSITGMTDLVKSGKGTLVLTGTNDYRETIVREGTLIGNAGSIRGNLANAATAVFNQSSDARFAGDIGGLLGASGQMIKRGSGTLTLDGVSALDWSIEEGGIVSAADRFGGDLDLAAGSRFTFDQSYDGAYHGTISGTGNLNLTGGGRIELSGDNFGFAGMTEVTNTTLIVNEDLGGSALIGAEGRLQGSGKIGSGAGSRVTLASGSTLAPGNSIGAMTVDGDLILEAGSRYEVEVAPGGPESDLIKVTGSATLEGGTVAHIGMTGTYDPARTYTILSAGDGVRGVFGDVTSDFAFLDPTLGYSGQDVTLTLARNDIAFVQAAETRNQRAAAQGLDSLSIGNDLYDKVVQLDEITARSAFDQLSGEIHASVMTGLIEDSRHIRNTANDRLRTVFEGVGVSATSRPVLAPSLPAAAFWGTGFGSWGATDSDGNAAALDRSTGGFVGGLDGMITDTWRLGLLAGYSHSSFTADNRASSASSDNYHVGLYAGSRWADLSFRSGLAYSWHDIDTSRAVGFTGFADRPSATYSADTFQAFGELAYGIDAQVARLEPFVNLAHVRVDTDNYREKGGAAALTASGQATDTTFTTIGLRTERNVKVGDMRISLTGMLGWRHAFGDKTPTASHAFVGSDAFTVAGNPISRDALVLDAGVGLDLTSEARLAISYQGQFGNGARDHGFNAKFGIRF